MKRKANGRAKFHLLHAMMADQSLSAPAKCAGVAMVLKFRNNKTGRCNPSFASIGEAIGRDRRNAINAVNELSERGWVTVETTKGGGKANTNSFVFDLSQRAPVTRLSPVPVTTSPRVMSSAAGVTSSPHEPTKNQSLSKERDIGSAIALAPDGAALAEAFEQLCRLWEASPYGVNLSKARKLFLTACKSEPAQAILASAEQWVAKQPPRFLPALEKWLGNEQWRKAPPHREAAAGGRRQTEDPAMAALRAAGWSVGGGE